MSQDMAWGILVAIAATGGIIWVITAVWFVSAVRARPAADPGDLPPTRARGVEGPPGDDVLTGRVEVAGRPDELSARLAETLGRSGLGGLLTRVIERTPDRVVFEVLSTPTQLAAVSRGGGDSGRRPVRGEVVFSPYGSGRTRVDYALAKGAGAWMVLAGYVVLALGLVALVAGFLGLRAGAVPSTNPGARAQVVQMVQCVHFLWPPWLFGILYRRSQDALRNALTVLLGNLPYL